ncbi:MAG TPA: hypothetical protein VMT03_07075 [Polyangia bacterium]|nr:hypothetical protein [Polyangia bacterium]
MKGIPTAGRQVCSGIAPLRAILLRRAKQGCHETDRQQGSEHADDQKNRPTLQRVTKDIVIGPYPTATVKA